MDTGDRLVIVMAGPPGAGKTTWALEAGLEVVSWESVGRWEAAFWAAVASVAADPLARVVIERPAPRIAHREGIAQSARADHIYVLAPEIEVVLARILHRERNAWRYELGACHDWFETYEPHPEHPSPPPASAIGSPQLR